MSAYSLYEVSDTVLPFETISAVGSSYGLSFVGTEVLLSSSAEEVIIPFICSSRRIISLDNELIYVVNSSEFTSSSLELDNVIDAGMLLN